MSTSDSSHIVVARQLTIRYLVIAATWFIFTGVGLGHWSSADTSALVQDAIGDSIYLIASSVFIWHWLRNRLAMEKAREGSIQRLEERFRKLFHESDLCHSLINPETGRIVDVNDATLNYYGLTREQALAMHVSDTTPMERDKIDALLKQAATRRQHIFGLQQRLASGEVREVEVYAEAIDFSGTTILYTTIVDRTDRARSEREMTQMNQLLRAMHDGLANAIEMTDRQTLSESITRSLVEEGRFSAAAMLQIPEHPSGEIRALATFGNRRLYSEAGAVTWSQQKSGMGPTGKSVRTRTIQVVNSVSRDASIEPWRAFILEQGIHSMASIPLEHEGRVKNVISVYSEREDTFSTPIVQLLDLLKSDVERSFMALDIAGRLEHAGVQRTLALTFAEGALFSVVETLSSALEARDPYTAGHQHNVAWLSCEIARRLKLAPDRIEGLRIGGLLHDIGKVAIPAELLSKPSAFSREEFDLVKTHAKIGGDILSRVVFPWPIQQIVTQHHERLDGSGYPNGLKGDAICIEAQLVAICDIVESISSRRPYREAKGDDVARSALKQGRGPLLNAEAVDVCLSILDDYGIEWLRTAKADTSIRGIKQSTKLAGH